MRSEYVDVEAILCLYELRTGSNLFCEPQRPIVKRWAEGIGCRTKKNPGWATELTAAEQFMLIAHTADHAKHRHAVEVEHGFCFRMVANANAIAGQAQNIRNTHRRSTEHITLDGNTISVPRRSLHDHRITTPR